MEVDSTRDWVIGCRIHRLLDSRAKATNAWTIVLTRRLLPGVATPRLTDLPTCVQVAQCDIGHRLHADRQCGLVQVKPRVVVTPDKPALRILATNEPERPRHRFQEVGEIL